MQIISIRHVDAEECGFSSDCVSSHSIEQLMFISGLRLDDKVMVMGPGAGGRLVELAHLGCRAAVAIDGRSPCLSCEDAEVVWMLGLTGGEEWVETAITRLGDPRAVVFEMTGPQALASLPPLLAALRGKGLLRCSYHRAEGRLFAIAWRPDALRRAA